MSRNLGRRDCARCGGNVALVGGRRPIGYGEARGYFEEYKSLVVANAECQLCGAKYLAWMEWGDRRGDPGVGPTDRAYFDLSYRSTFNDEPGPEDLPARAGVPRSRIGDLRVKSIERRSIVGYAELTIEAACLDPSPNLEAMKVRIESAAEMEALLRDRVRWYGGEPDASWLIDRNAILARIDAASEPRQPR